MDETTLYYLLLDLDRALMMSRADAQTAYALQRWNRHFDGHTKSRHIPREVTPAADEVFTLIARIIRDQQLRLRCLEHALAAELVVCDARREVRGAWLSAVRGEQPPPLNLPADALVIRIDP